MKTKNKKFNLEKILKFSTKLWVQTCGWIIFSLLGIWSCFALYFSNLPEQWMRSVSAWTFFGAIAIVVSFVPHRRRNALFICLAYLGIIIWFLLIPAPPNNLDWRPGNGRAPYAKIEGTKLTLYDVRNFAYSSADKFVEDYENRVYDLNKLDTMDLLLSYWGDNKAIAHFMLSFGFEGDKYLAVSMETRVKKGVPQSALRGFFRQFGIICIFGDENDLIKLRTNYRDEKVYLYRFSKRFSKKEIRAVFMDLIQRCNLLHDKPRFYNAVTFNCLTSLIPSMCVWRPGIRFDYRILFNGWMDELLWEREVIVGHKLSFDALRKTSNINQYINKQDSGIEFSRKIRRGVDKLKQMD